METENQVQVFLVNESVKASACLVNISGQNRYSVVHSTVELQWLEHLWLVYHSCFELILESLGKTPIAADLG